VFGPSIQEQPDIQVAVRVNNSRKPEPMLVPSCSFEKEPVLVGMLVGWWIVLNERSLSHRASTHLHRQ